MGLLQTECPQYVLNHTIKKAKMGLENKRIFWWVGVQWAVVILLLMRRKEGEIKWLGKWGSTPVINCVTNDLGCSSLKPKPSADLGQNRLALAGLDMLLLGWLVNEGQGLAVLGLLAKRRRWLGPASVMVHRGSLGWWQISKTKAWVQTVLCHFYYILLPKASRRWWGNRCYLLLGKLQRIMATFAILQMVRNRRDELERTKRKTK